MSENAILLCGTAASVGAVHTLLGPDHYLPFLAMARAGCWSLKKTVLITVLCGLGHILSSVALGTLGIVLGTAVFKLERIEALRAGVAGWLLLTFGLVYFIWGVRRAIRNQPHTHLHIHADGTVHEHEHRHAHDHVHAHVTTPAADARARSITPWALFVVFVFGPCETLIPLLMYPAAQGHVGHVILVAAVFGVATLTTMTATVVLAHLVSGPLTFRGLDRFNHALAGLALMLCGAAITAGL